MLKPNILSWAVRPAWACAYLLQPHPVPLLPAVCILAFSWFLQYTLLVSSFKAFGCLVPFAFTVGPSLPLAFFSSSSLSLIRDSTISLVSSPVPCMCRHLINFCQMNSLMAYWWGFQVYGCDPGSVPSWGTERSCKLCSKARKKQKFKTKKMPKKFSFCQMNGCGSMRTWVQILPLTKYIALASHLFDL